MYPRTSAHDAEGICTVGIPLRSVPRASLQAKGGQQILVELHPDRVAGIDAQAIDPSTFPTRCPHEGVPIPVGVAPKAGKRVRQLSIQRGELSADRPEGVQDPVVPTVIGVVVRRHRLARQGSHLPPGRGVQESGVQGHEPRVHVDHNRSGTRGIELSGQASPVLISPGSGQGPAADAGELGSSHPTERLKVQKVLLDLLRILPEASGDRARVGEPEQTNRVQGQVDRLRRASLHPPILSVARTRGAQRARPSASAQVVRPGRSRCPTGAIRTGRRQLGVPGPGHAARPVDRSRHAASAGDRCRSKASRARRGRDRRLDEWECISQESLFGDEQGGGGPSCAGQCCW